ncbi:hypothetical protein FT642_20175 [Bacillus paranthracis]|uniref:hypothetical protein n=1 Tax=Bacillus paranthracis TaxID=2026186 RepID=UPI00187A17DD|nr:hypothetical protein [Bacillus paranthracis]MBE7133910.1 hypothetical protein [Bacillus paranthracis]WAI24426.1 MAG: hypothetical protein NRZ50_15365 [Bacillus paranthracis]WAI32610.1 MAG: hypothetical protein NRZ52_27910 [Bacillus paranthracis]WAI39248.1 MAG: hypothetical protein NRZ51_04635 [Bacillus paranthracis]
MKNIIEIDTKCLGEALKELLQDISIPSFSQKEIQMIVSMFENDALRFKERRRLSIKKKQSQQKNWKRWKKKNNRIVKTY